MSSDSITVSREVPPAISGGRISLTQRLFRRQMQTVLSGLRHGELQVQESGTSATYGEPASDGLQVAVQIHHPQLYSRMFREGSLGAAEAYLQGDWDCADLVGFLRLLCRNMDQLMGLETGLARVGQLAARLLHFRSRNSRQGSQKNIAAHYDLSNDFFSLFLDETLMYSSAYFTSEQQSLTEASLAKLDLVCRKLNLRPGDHVLEIGTGWGGFARYAVENYGCRITTTTISRQQHDCAARRFAAAGLTDRIELLLSDYRDLRGQYDKLVSIEMIEAVGAEYLPQFFRQCESLLKPGGQMLVQSILMPDHRYERYCKSVDFIQKYIFPGGHLPSVSALQSALSPDSPLRLTHFEEFAESYARTLAAWRAVFLARLDQVTELGFDRRFIRMWDYYLCYCEAAFWERATSVGQFVWEKTRY